MATASKKNAPTKKGAKKTVALPKPSRCVTACVKEFIACLAAGGNKRVCRNKLTRCVEDCIDAGRS
jgi:hypothetical protein